MKNRILLLMLAAMAGTAFLRAQSPKMITVDAGKPVAPIQSTMWGVFFEDINLAADGGVYAEMVKNRSFEFLQPLMGWKILKSDTTTGILILNRGAGYRNNPRFVRITAGENEKRYGLSNAGFRGMGIQEGMVYHFSVNACLQPGSTLKLTAELVDSKGKVAGKATLEPAGNDWKKYTADITSTVTDARGKLNVWIEGQGSIDLDMISLFPDNTWKHRPGGLRADLVQLLADLKPGFVRFPGGCIVEGRDLGNRYQWKNTIGNAEDRPLMINRWNTEFKHRLTPDYFQSFGLGFYEYFLLAEDIGAEPLPILNCGMACQYNTAELVPMDQLDPYIQDALDLIEFANGPAYSEWGKIRMQMGHPAPFHLKMIGVGNEQWGPQYIERYKAFAAVLKAKYPDIKLVSGAGPSPDGSFFDYASGELKQLGADIVDEHYYANPAWFLQHATRYDNYDRNSYKIFAGEYAAQEKFTTSPENHNNWECALAEAAFMTGLERNAAVVHLCSYAPLFAHVDGWQWKPDLIWFDNLRSFGTPNYYVQQMYSTNKGTEVLSILSNGSPLTGSDGLYGSAAYDQVSGDVIIKLVHTGTAPVRVAVKLTGKKPAASAVRIQEMAASDLSTVNTLDAPKTISPVSGETILRQNTLTCELKPASFTVFRVKVKK